MSGEFERLMADIEAEIESAEGGWSVSWGDTLVITQRESRDPNRSNNGGEYYYYKNYRPDDFGIDVWESLSCDIAPRREYGGEESHYNCLVSIDGLTRMAKLAEVTTAAKSWLKKEPGCMKRLKAAIKALE